MLTRRTTAVGRPILGNIRTCRVLDVSLHPSCGIKDSLSLHKVLWFHSRITPGRYQSPHLPAYASGNSSWQWRPSLSVRIIEKNILIKGRGTNMVRAPVRRINGYGIFTNRDRSIRFQKGEVIAIIYVDNYLFFLRQPKSLNRYIIKSAKNTT